MGVCVPMYFLSPAAGSMSQPRLILCIRGGLIAGQLSASPGQWLWKELSSWIAWPSKERDLCQSMLFARPEA